MIILHTVVLPEAVPPATPENKQIDDGNQRNQFFENPKRKEIKSVPITKGCLRGAGAEGETLSLIEQ